MVAGRVQVQELAAPEAVKPSPLASDTFEHAAPPMVDNNLERLAASLGHFMTGWNHYQKINEHEVSKDHLAQLEQWRQARTSTQALEEIRAGKAPYWADPIYKAAYGKLYASLEGEGLAAELDKKLAGQNIPDFGRDNFNPDQYVVDAAKPYMARMSGDPHATLAMGDHVDALRKSFRAAHQSALGQRNTQIAEDGFYGQVRSAFLSAAQQNQGKAPDAEDRVTGQGIMDALRGDGGAYQSFGPRVKGGALDLKSGRQDEIAIEAAAEMAKHPETAQLAVEFLKSARTHEDGSQSTLLDSRKGNEKSLPILDAAKHTLLTRAKSGVDQQAAEAAYQALKRGDASYNLITDQQTTFKLDPENPYTVSAEKAKKVALQRFLEERHAVISQEPPEKQGEAIDTELRTLARSNIEHPQIVPFLKSVAGGLAQVDMTKGEFAPGQLETVQKAAELYDRINRISPDYAEKVVGSQHAAFYEAYTTLVREGWNPRQAALGAARPIYGDAADRRFVDVKKIAKATSTIDMSYNYGWGPYFKSWFTGGVDNSGDLEKAILKKARTLAAVDGISGDTAITRATEQVKQSTIAINGRAVIDPFLHPGQHATGDNDEDAVYAFLKQAWKQNKDVMSRQGVAKWQDLTIRASSPGVYEILKKDDGTNAAISKPIQALNSAGQLQEMTFSYQQLREYQAGEREKKALKALNMTQELLKKPDAWAEDVAAVLPKHPQVVRQRRIKEALGQMTPQERLNRMKNGHGLPDTEWFSQKWDPEKNAWGPATSTIRDRNGN